MDKQELISELAKRQLDREPPKSQYDCCLIAARCSVAVGDAPKTEGEFLAAARGAAKGLFGPAYEAADEGQKWTWIDMCERALREAAGAEKI